MERISEILQPYKNIIGTVASYLTIAQFFSGIFICLNIYKKGSTHGISAIPFVGGIMMGLTMFKYGLMLQDAAMLTVNSAAIFLNVVYSGFYYLYSTDKWNEFLKPLSVCAAVVAVLWGYCQWEDPLTVEFRYGLIVTVLMLLLLGNPLLGIKEIIKKKDASEIPFVLTLMSTLVTFAWFLYALVLLNSFMIIQNVIGFVLCFIQMILIFLYPGKGNGEPNKKEKD